MFKHKQVGGTGNKLAGSSPSMIHNVPLHTCRPPEGPPQAVDCALHFSGSFYIVILFVLHFFCHAYHNTVFVCFCLAYSHGYGHTFLFLSPSFSLFAIYYTSYPFFCPFTYLNTPFAAFVSCFAPSLPLLSLSPSSPILVTRLECRLLPSAPMVCDFSFFPLLSHKLTSLLQLNLI
jgi:hypothetical protein